MEEGYRAVMLNPEDSVAVALSPIPAGAAVEVSCRGSRFTVVLRDAVEFGHKFAVVPIRKGQEVRKYGEVIGAATRNIRVGSTSTSTIWRERGEGVIGLCAESLPELMGYRRPDGRMGVRNPVLILPTITCATQAAWRMTELVHGTVSFIHQHGCVQVGADYEQAFRTYV